MSEPSTSTRKRRSLLRSATPAFAPAREGAQPGDEEPSDISEAFGAPAGIVPSAPPGVADASDAPEPVALKRTPSSEEGRVRAPPSRPPAAAPPAMPTDPASLPPIPPVPGELRTTVPLAEVETPLFAPRQPQGTPTATPAPQSEGARGPTSPAPVVPRGWTAPPPPARPAPQPEPGTTWVVAGLLGGAVALAVVLVLGAIGLGSFDGAAPVPPPDGPALGDAMHAAPEVVPPPPPPAAEEPAPAEVAPEAPAADPAAEDERTKVKLPKVRIGKKKEE